VREAPREDTASEFPSDEWTGTRLRYCYDDASFIDAARAIAEESRSSFRRQTIYRLSRLTLGIGAFFVVFIFSLSWAAIPTETSTRWIGREVSTETVGLPGWDFALPTFPYLSVSLLLAIVATAAVVAFALTEDRYSSAISEVLVRGPADRCVSIGAPYWMLKKRSVGAG
jgi:hypothetical protein